MIMLPIIMLVTHPTSLNQDICDMHIPVAFKYEIAAADCLRLPA